MKALLIFLFIAFSFTLSCNAQNTSEDKLNRGFDNIMRRRLHESIVEARENIRHAELHKNKNPLAFSHRVNTNRGFSISFPNRPEYSIDQKNNTQIYKYSGSNYIYMVQITDLIPTQGNLSVHDNQNQVVNNFLHGIEGRLTSNVYKTYYNGVQCLDFNFSIQYSNIRRFKCRALVLQNSLITIFYGAVSPKQIDFDSFINTLHL